MAVKKKVIKQTEKEKPKMKQPKFTTSDARDFMNSALDKQWGLGKIKDIIKAERMEPSGQPCDDRCKLRKSVQRGKTLVQIFGPDGRVMGQVTAEVFGDGMMEAAYILLFTLGQGYSKADVLRVKKLLLFGD